MLQSLVRGLRENKKAGDRWSGTCSWFKGLAEFGGFYPRDGVDRHRPRSRFVVLTAAARKGMDYEWRENPRGRTSGGRPLRPLLRPFRIHQGNARGTIRPVQVLGCGEGNDRDSELGQHRGRDRRGSTARRTAQIAASTLVRAADLYLRVSAAGSQTSPQPAFRSRAWSTRANSTCARSCGTIDRGRTVTRSLSPLPSRTWISPRSKSTSLTRS